MENTHSKVQKLRFFMLGEEKEEKRGKGGVRRREGGERERERERERECEGEEEGEREGNLNGEGGGTSKEEVNRVHFITYALGGGGVRRRRRRGRERGGGGGEGKPGGGVQRGG